MPPSCEKTESGFFGAHLSSNHYLTMINPGPDDPQRYGYWAGIEACRSFMEAQDDGYLSD